MKVEHASLHHTFLAAVALVLYSGLAGADRITLEGQTWDEVLIYQSSTMYYVKVPDTGEIFNVPINSVPASDIIINRDPYYRDDLRKRFDQNSAGKRRSAGEGVGTSAFNVAETSSAGAAPADGGAEQAGPMAAVRAALGNLGFTFSDEGGDLVAKSPDGSTTVRFVGGTPLGGVEYVSTLPEAQAGQHGMAINMLGGMAAQGAPWVQEFMQQDVAPLLNSGGTAEKSQGPISVKAEVTKADGNVTLQIKTGPAAG